MKRLISLAIAPLLILSICATPALAATPKAGTKCPTFGQSVIASGKKFTCLMLGSKQVWNKGVKVASSSGSTSKPSPFKAPIPISLPVAQNGSITFSNLLSQIGNVDQVAYQRVQDALANNSAPKAINNDVHVGPNTKIDVTGGLPRIQEILNRTQKVFSGFTQVSNFSMLIYNAKDEPWAEAEWVSFATARNYLQGQIRGQKNTIAGNCQTTITPGVFTGTISNCGGADSSAIQNSDDAILTFGQSDEGNPGDSFLNKGGVVGHEYVHAVQAAQWIGNSKTYCTEATNSPDCFRSHYVNNTVPCWLNEGSANSIGPMAALSTLAEYQTFHKNQLPFNQGPTTVTDYSEKSLRDFLYNQEIGDRGCISNMPVYRLGYSVGALTAEMLTAIGGPQSVMAIYAKCAEGLNFPTAFAAVYGITWENASAIIAKALAAEYATFGAPPR